MKDGEENQVSVCVSGEQRAETRRRVIVKKSRDAMTSGDRQKRESRTAIATPQEGGGRERRWAVRSGILSRSFFNFLESSFWGCTVPIHMHSIVCFFFIKGHHLQPFGGVKEEDEGEGASVPSRTRDGRSART